MQPLAPHRRLMPALVLALLLVLAGTACGQDEPDVVSPAPVDPNVEVGSPLEPSLVGLEVTASGNVTEVVAPIAFRIDKDGIDPAEGEPDFGDEDFGDLDFAREDVLVLDVRETKVDPGVAVEVTGTVREFDLPEAERVFDVDLDEKLYGPFRDVLVIVADSVTKKPSAGGAGGASPSRADIDYDSIGPEASMVGLEVTAVGNVTEVVSPMAFKIDKDGAGPEVNVQFDDEVFDDLEPAQRPVLVLDTTKTPALEMESAVRVSGTIRQFDVDDAERLFGVDLDDRLYGPFDDMLVIVADRVTKVPLP